MNCWRMVLADGAGLRKPTLSRHTTRTNSSTARARSPLVEQGGNGPRQLQNGVRHSNGMLSVGLVVGLAVPPYGLPSADPTQPRSVASFGCRGQPGGGPGRRRSLLRGLPPSLTGLGRLTPTTNPRALREFPLDPLPSRATADSRRSRDRPGPVDVPSGRHT